MKVRWDPNKERLNVKKHGFGFSYAAEVFADPRQLIAYDEAHSGTEDRYIHIGKAYDEAVLFVVETELTDDVVWIISARKATRREREEYANG